jgi:hypothetical protein
MDITRKQYLRRPSTKHGSTIIGVIVALSDGRIGISRLHKEDEKEVKEKRAQLRKQIAEFRREQGKAQQKCIEVPAELKLPPIFDKETALKIAVENATNDKIDLKKLPEHLRRSVYRFIRSVGADRFARERLFPRAKKA